MGWCSDMNSEFLKDLGKRISTRRKALGLTQERLAEELEVSIQMISNLECGRKAVRLPNLVKLSKILKISCDFLLTGERIQGDFEDLSARLALLSEEDYEMIRLIVDYCINKKI